MSKRFIAIFIILCFLTVIFIPENTTAETVYLGGSSNIGSGPGTSGDHAINLIPGFPMALRLSIQVQKPGDFAEQGYANSYPVSEYSLVLVPPGTPKKGKNRNVLASKVNGKCEYVSDHPGVVLGDEGGAKEAIWKLFVGDKSDIYQGDATTLIGDGSTIDYTSLVDTELFTKQAGMSLGIVLLAGGQMYVSTQEIPKDDEVKQVQMALTGITLGYALKALGQDLELEDMANYFLGKESKNEYIVIIENMLTCYDTANPDIEYWWTLPNTAISQISGHDVLPEEYSGTTGEYLKNVCVNKIKPQEGDNKHGFRAVSGNKSQQYLFNYWFTPTYNNGWWATNMAVTSLWYTRDEKKDEGDNLIWGAQYPAVNPNNLIEGKFGFNVLTCFASNPAPPKGGDGVHQLYSDPEVIHAERSQEVKAKQSADFTQYDDEIKENIVNNVYNQYITKLHEHYAEILEEHKYELFPWKEDLYLEFNSIGYDIKFEGNVGSGTENRVGPGKFKKGTEKRDYDEYSFSSTPPKEDGEKPTPKPIKKVHKVMITEKGMYPDPSSSTEQKYVKDAIRKAIDDFPNDWQVGYTKGTFDEPGTYIWEYYSYAYLKASVVRAITGGDDGTKFINKRLENISLKNSYAKTLIIVPNISRQYLRWYNQPLGFAEVKQGTWSGDRSTEKWEAMAGVPTTETLYINAGGTPVFCDIKAKYTEASVTKDYQQEYTHSFPMGDKTESHTCEVEKPITFNFSYITIESVTIRTAEKAILNNAKIFVEPRQEVGVFDKVVCEVDGNNKYYQDGRGEDPETFAYGLSSEDYMWSGSGGEDTRHAGEILDEHLKKIKVFRNSDKVTIYIDGIAYEILVGAHDVGTVVPSDDYPEPATLTVDISEQWKPTEPNGTYIWDKYTKIPVVGYIGDPKAGEEFRWRYYRKVI